MKPRELSSEQKRKLHADYVRSQYEHRSLQPLRRTDLNQFMVRTMLVLVTIAITAILIYMNSGNIPTYILGFMRGSALALFLYSLYVLVFSETIKFLDNRIFTYSPNPEDYTIDLGAYVRNRKEDKRWMRLKNFMLKLPHRFPSTELNRTIISLSVAIISLNMLFRAMNVVDLTRFSAYDLAQSAIIAFLALVTSALSLYLETSKETFEL